jgi:hypothetical protein
MAENFDPYPTNNGCIRNGFFIRNDIKGGMVNENDTAEWYTRHDGANCIDLSLGKTDMLSEHGFPKVAANDLDREIENSTINYNIEQVNGCKVVCYPSPFSDSFSIDFSLPKDDYVSIVIIDNFGKLVSTVLSNKFLSADSYNFIYNSSELSSGQYFMIFDSKEIQSVVKITKM